MTTVFEETNISKAIFRVGLPAMLGQLTTLVYNIADTFFVSMAKQPAMIAAVTLCAPVLLIIMSIACIFGMGGSSVIARLIGEGEKKKARQTFRFSVYAMVCSGIIVLSIGLLLLKPIVNLVGADTETFGYTCDYLKYLFIGAPFIMIANGYVHLFRSVGMVKESTFALIMGNAINIVLDYILIVVFPLGTAGAAIATSVGFACSTVYCIACTVIKKKKGNELVSLTVGRSDRYPGMMQKVVSIGIPGALVTVLMSVANIVLNNYIGIYGAGAVASYGIAYKIDMIPIMLSVGLSQGVMPLIGYCFGAKQGKKMSRVMRLATLYGMILGAIFMLLFLVGGKVFAKAFLDDKDLILQTAFFLHILCLSAPLLGVINMVTSYFQALGKAVQSLLITVLRNIVLFIPCVILFNRFWKLNGVIAAQPVTEAVLTVICLVLYYSFSRKLKIL